MIFTSPQQRSPSRLHSRHGFTVIELLVAATVTAMLAGILLIMTNGVLNVWNRTSGLLGTNAQAELIFDVLTDDLQSAVRRNDGRVWLAVEILEDPVDIINHQWTDTSVSGNIKPGGTISRKREDPSNANMPLEETRYGLGGAWLRFFTGSSGDGTRAVAYQVARRRITGDPKDPGNPAPIRYMLYRSEYNVAETLARGFDLNPTGFFPTGVGYTGSGNKLIDPPSAEVMGNNVIDFGIRLYARQLPTGGLPGGATLRPIFPADPSTDEWDNDVTGYLAVGLAQAPGYSGGTRRDVYPDVVDVMVRILTDEGVKQITNLEDGFVLPPSSMTFEEAWWAIAEEHSRVFTRRIFLNTSPY